MKLLVEDEERMAQALTKLLKQEAHEVDVCSDGVSGLDAVLIDIYDVVALDVMLPEKSCFSIMQEMQKAGVKTPILMLTVKGKLDDVVQSPSKDGCTALTFSSVCKIFPSCELRS